MQAFGFDGSTLLVRWSNKMITVIVYRCSLCDDCGAIDRCDLIADQMYVKLQTTYSIKALQVLGPIPVLLP